MNSYTTFIILLHLIGGGGACYNCDYCVSNTCRDPANNFCICEYGCKPGYYGYKCVNACPEQCFTCGRQYALPGDATQGICYECNDGYHNGSSTNCLCPINCQKCTSTTQCTLCNQGWYGTVCELSCPTNCKDKICGKEDGNCSIGCINGWYSTKCEKKCPNASSCKDNKCNQTDGVCYECSPGKHGSNCDTDCRSINCLDNECNRTNGLCTKNCSGKFAPGNEYLCQTCIAGKYGDTCDKDCLSSNCENNQCDKITGTCIDECIDNYDLGSDKLCDTCAECSYGVNADGQDIKDDTSTHIGLIVGWIFGGLCFTVIVVFVIYKGFVRRNSATPETRREAGQYDNQVIYVNTDVELSVEPEQVTTYEELNTRTDEDPSVYNVLQ